MKPTRLRQAAERDLEQIASWYAAEAGLAIADRFIDEIDSVRTVLGDHPELGHRDIGESISLPELRRFPTRIFPYNIYFYDRGDYLEIVRVVSTSREIRRRFFSA